MAAGIPRQARTIDGPAEVLVHNSEGDAYDWPLVVGGDHRAFERIFDRHSELVYRFVRRRTGDASLAEEVTAQVFLEMWRQRRKVRVLNGSLRSWLIGVAANLVRRHWRTLARRERALVRLPQLDTPDHADEVVSHMDNEATLRELGSRLAGLPKHQRDVLLLWACEGLNYSEIAQVLDVPVGTVRSRLSRARTQLTERDGTAGGNREYRYCKSIGGDMAVPTERIEP